VTGCTSGTQRPQVRDVAVEFVTAVQDRNGEQACTLLTDEAQESASGATDVPCEQAVLNIEENGTAVHSVQIWDDSAQVKLGSDTVFLRWLSGGWQVRAAGCEFQPGAAYRCDVEG
jgi:hypothetical protein